MRRIVKKTAHVAKRKPFHAAVVCLVVLVNIALVGVIVIANNGKLFAAGSPPINTITPFLYGTAAVDQTMGVTNGSWTGAPEFSYQWQSCDSNGLNCVDISGETNNTYVVKSTDINNKLRAVVTATDISDPQDPQSTSANSDISSVVQAQLGDINGDGVINIFDLGMLLGKYLSGSNNTLEDLNTDGIVNDADIQVLLGMYQP